MSVDMKLHKLINELDDRLFRIPLDDVDISVRTRNALRKLGARTLGCAQRLFITQRLEEMPGIGPAALKELEGTILSATAILPRPTRDRERALQQVVEMFLSWTGALAVTGSPEPDAWRELVTLRARAEALLNREEGAN